MALERLLAGALGVGCWWNGWEMVAGGVWWLLGCRYSERLPPVLADGLDGRGRARDGSTPERGRPGCGQLEVGGARPGQQPGMSAKQNLLCKSHNNWCDLKQSLSPL